jgi:hypothetical protein
MSGNFTAFTPRGENSAALSNDFAISDRTATEMKFGRSQATGVFKKKKSL